MLVKIFRKLLGTHLNFSIFSRLAIGVALNMILPSATFAIDPPENIRLDGDVLRWDETPDAFEYHIYYFDEQIPSNSVLGNYLNVTTGRSWPLGARLEPSGYYTVVAVHVNIQTSLVEYSAVTDGKIVPYLEPNGNTAAVVVEQRCDGVVAGSSCTARCIAPAIPTGGACRADSGVTLHQRAMQSGYQCLSQQDTSFVETDVYCLTIDSD